jgi:hypothetical protein
LDRAAHQQLIRTKLGQALQTELDREIPETMVALLMQLDAA